MASLVEGRREVRHDGVDVDVDDCERSKARCISFPREEKETTDGLGKERGST
jgi:hypothetical protein